MTWRDTGLPKPLKKFLKKERSKFDDDLKRKIKRLASEREKNELLSYELSGYMKDSDRRKIFKEMAKHKIHEKKKYIYIDQETSGKFLVQKSGGDAGHVWGIKGYGQKGHYLGDIDKVTKEYEKANKTLVKGVMDRSLKRRKK